MQAMARSRLVSFCCQGPNGMSRNPQTCCPDLCDSTGSLKLGEIALEAEQQSPLPYLEVMIRARSILTASFKNSCTVSKVAALLLFICQVIILLEILDVTQNGIRRTTQNEKRPSRANCPSGVSMLETTSITQAEGKPHAADRSSAQPSYQPSQRSSF